LLNAININESLS